MMRSSWLIALVMLLATGCTRAASVEEPRPMITEVESAPAPITEPTSDVMDVNGWPDTATAVLGAVEAEVRELFGETELEELTAAVPTWDIPITMNAAVERWLEYFQGDGRENFAIYLSRAGRYEPMMRAILRDAGLPEDLVYISLIESGFSPRAYSRARAVGLWQFIYSTGRLYDLNVSYWVDERRDPILATKAAAAHLRDLHAEFGSWYLAAAAYNGGPTRVRRSIRRTGSDDFWTLARRRYLRRETRNYVPKLIAAALIAKQPEHFAFFDIQEAEPMAYDIVQVPDATSLDVVADAAGFSLADVVQLNPQILRGVTPPGQSYAVRVPPGGSHLFAINYARVPASERVSWVQHVVRRGDTLGEIARAYGVSVSAIRAANNNVHPRRLKIGQSLVIPRAGKLPHVAATSVRVTRRPPLPSTFERPEGPYVNYRVQRGDSLWTIAQRFDVTARQLMVWNGLTSSRIYPGDEFRIYVDAAN